MLAAYRQLSDVTSQPDTARAVDPSLPDAIQIRAGRRPPSALFGLASSLILGFLELQAGQAQNRFYNELEDWLSNHTRLSGGGGMVEGDHSVPVYIQALLEQTADGLENLQRIISRNEEGRVASQNAMLSLAEKLASLSDHMKRPAVSPGLELR